MQCGGSLRAVPVHLQGKCREGQAQLGTTAATVAIMFALPAPAPGLVGNTRAPVAPGPGGRGREEEPTCCHHCCCLGLEQLWSSLCPWSVGDSRDSGSKGQGRGKNRRGIKVTLSTEGKGGGVLTCSGDLTNPWVLLPQHGLKEGCDCGTAPSLGLALHGAPILTEVSHEM